MPPSDAAVLLLQMGGPATLADVRPFLRNLLSDPAILSLPAALRVPLARFIAWRRAPRVVEQYRRIGGGSPIGATTAAQARALEAALAAAGAPMPVRVAMRYVAPRAEAALREFAAAGVRRIVLLPLYPQASATTTGSSLDEARALAARLCPGAEVRAVEDWADHPGYVAALAASVRRGIDQVPAHLRDRARLLWSAHGLPVRYVERGDRYPERVAATVAAATPLLGPDAPPGSVCWQSRVGPVKWLAPSTDDAIRQAAAEGAKALVVVPVAFVSDHLETLYEVDLEYRHVAREAGIEAFVRVPALNDDPALAAALADIVRQAR
jgi:protoporphyrin/coproporphyrin ferrochelatase